MARSIKIAYGGVTIGAGGDSSYVLVDRYTFVSGYTTASISCDVVVTNASQSTFLSKEAALIAAFRVQNGTLDVELGGTDRHSFAPASNTGFLARATCEKVGGEEDTEKSSRYRCSVTVELPADEGKSGRRGAVIDVAQGDSERQVLTLSGEYTALSSNSASAQFTAAIDAWAATVHSSLGGTWQLIGRVQRYDDEDKVLSFTDAYEKILLDESVGAADVSSLCNQQLRIVRSRYSEPHAIGKGTVVPLQNIAGIYSVSVRSSVTTDLATLYSQTIRQQMVSQITAVLGGGTLIVTREFPSFDAANNRVSVVIEGRVDKGSDYLELVMVTTDTMDAGRILIPVWDGNPYSRREYQGPKTHTKRVRVSYTVRKDANATIIAPSFDGFREIGRTQQSQLHRIGVPELSGDYWVVRQGFAFVRVDEPGSSDPLAGMSTEDEVPGGITGVAF